MPEEAVDVMPEPPAIEAGGPEIVPEPPAEPPVPDTVELPGEPPAEPGEEPPKPETPVAEALPAELAKALRELKQAHPEQAGALKSLNDAWRAKLAFDGVFKGGVDEARALKADLEALGGSEGIAQMRRDIDGIEQFDEMAAQGDPKVIDSLSETFPDGFKAMMPHAIETLKRLDPERYAEVMRGPYLSILSGDGVINALANAIEEAKGNNPQAALRYLNQIANYVNELSNKEEQYKARRVNPRTEEFQRRDADVRQREMRVNQQQYTREIVSYVGETVDKALAPLIAERKLNAEAAKHLRTSSWNEMKGSLRANQTFMDTVERLVRKGDVDGAVRYAKVSIDAQRQKAVNAVWTRLYGNAPVTPKPTPVGRAGNGNGQPAARAYKPGDRPTPLTGPPRDEDIDWKKDPNQLLFITGKAILKNGKFVTWKK